MLKESIGCLPHNSLELSHSDSIPELSFQTSNSISKTPILPGWASATFYPIFLTSEKKPSRNLSASSGKSVDILGMPNSTIF